MSADDVIHKLIDDQQHRQRQLEFAQVDRRTLLKLSDAELALWQSDYPQGSPHYILAEFEWQRRINAEQVKATKFSAWIGVAGTLLGAALGFVLSQYANTHGIGIQPKTVTENRANQHVDNKKLDAPAPINPPVIKPDVNTP
jgi:hypothetical protein